LLINSPIGLPLFPLFNKIFLFPFHVLKSSCDQIDLCTSKSFSAKCPCFQSAPKGIDTTNVFVFVLRIFNVSIATFFSRCSITSPAYIKSYLPNVLQIGEAHIDAIFFDTFYQLEGKKEKDFLRKVESYFIEEGQK